MNVCVRAAVVFHQKIGSGLLTMEVRFIHGHRIPRKDGGTFLCATSAKNARLGKRQNQIDFIAVIFLRDGRYGQTFLQ